MPTPRSSAWAPSISSSQARGASAQVFAFLVLEEEEAEKPGAAILPCFSGRVDFDNVSFAYDSDAPVLRGVQLTAHAGEVRSEERRVGKECRSRWSPYH